MIRCVRYILGAALMVLPLTATAYAQQRAPRHVVAPSWPQPLPDNMILGQVAGIAVGKQDTVWIVQRPSTLVDDELGATKNPPETRCCKAAPPVLQFSREGKLLKSWGGPGQGYDWPKSEHGIHIDIDGNVWLAGNSDADHMILQFTPEGKFLKQIGKPGKSEGSNSQTQLGRPAHMTIDEKAKELYVADGYGNRRIIVFNSSTGAYKRHWGAYGTKTPTDDKLTPYKPVAITELSKSFGNPVHCVRLSNDGLVYVCDRANDRIQVFTTEGKFMTEFQVEPNTLQNGSVWDLVLSEDKAQRYIYVADGANMQIYALDRKTGKKLSAFGRPGRMAGEFKWVHNMAIDSRGNIYTAEVGTGRRAQKFRKVASDE
jgi:NHL repeat